jgi:hypothetical protein
MSLPPPEQWRPPQPQSAPVQPPQGPPPGQPPWGGQRAWSQPPGPPPNPGNSLKWLLIAVAVLLIIAISVGLTLLVTRNSGGAPPTASPTTSGAAGDIASADDTGPVSIITADPTCPTWTTIRNALAAQQGNGWDKRDASIPASDWTAAMRTQFEAVASAMRSSADQTVTLAKLTPHRTMRELYEQFIAYSRSYADSVSTYTARDDHLAQVVIGTSISLGSICNAITYGSAAVRAPLVTAIPAPPQPMPPAEDPSNPSRFLTGANPQCSRWISRSDQFDTEVADWLKQDPNIPNQQWTAEQRAAESAVVPIMNAFADDIESIGQQSRNSVFQDIAAFAAQYFRGFTASIPSYTAADNYLATAGLRIVGIAIQACKSAET